MRVSACCIASRRTHVVVARSTCSRRTAQIGASCLHRCSCRPWPMQWPCGICRAISMRVVLVTCWCSGSWRTRPAVSTPRRARTACVATASACRFATTRRVSLGCSGRHSRAASSWSTVGPGSRSFASPSTHRCTALRTDSDVVRRITFEGVTFEGLLRVTDPVAFRQAVEFGIGPARAYGFGLLSFRPM